jgi:hypothetical protein
LSIGISSTKPPVRIKSQQFIGYIRLTSGRVLGLSESQQNADLPDVAPGSKDNCRHIVSLLIVAKSCEAGSRIVWRVSEDMVQIQLLLFERQ